MMQDQNKRHQLEDAVESLSQSALSRRALLGKSARLAAFGAIATTASISLVACAEDDEDEPDDPAIDSDDDEAVDAAEDVDDEPDDDSAAVPDDDRYGGTLTIVRRTEEDTLEPGGDQSLDQTKFLLYDGLIIHGFDGELYPALATDWESNTEGNEWTFTLRDDVTFHSGEEFSAEHVVDHFERWKDRPTSSKIAQMDEVELVDDYTVRFHLIEPSFLFLTLISQTEWGYGSIPNMHSVAELGDDYGIVDVDGTGPFKLEEWRVDDRMVLTRNEDYTWGPEFYENTGPAYPDQLILLVIPEEASRTAMVETGEADIGIDIPSRDVGRLEDEPGITIETFPRISSNQMYFNMDRDLFQDINVRRAVMHGVNRAEIAEFIMHGQADPAEGYLHPDVLGATDREETRSLVEYNPELAIELLEESGWEVGADGVREKDGEQISFAIYIQQELHEQIVQPIQDQLREIGIDMQIQRFEPGAATDLIEAGEHDMAFRPMIYVSGDSMWFFISDAIPSPNSGFWSDPEFDELFAMSQTATDEDEMYGIYSQMEMRLLEEAVVVPIQHERWIFAMNDRVEGANLDTVHGIYKMMDFWLDG